LSNSIIDININSPENHLWTDVLHARSLARQSLNSWDRGTYVRWCIITTWICVEIVFRQVLNEPRIGHRFKEDVDSALNNLGLSRLNWGEGVWQKLLKLQVQRHKLIHSIQIQSELFPESTVAENYVSDARDAIIEIYKHAGQDIPRWINYDIDLGWDSGKSSGAHGTLIKSGASIENPDDIRIFYEYKGKEFLSTILSSKESFEIELNKLLENIRLPITRIKVTRGSEVILEKSLVTRGTS
jgi:hypothetical protein